MGTLSHEQRGHPRPQMPGRWVSGDKSSKASDPLGCPEGLLSCLRAQNLGMNSRASSARCLSELAATVLPVPGCKQLCLCVLKGTTQPGSAVESSGYQRRHPNRPQATTPGPHTPAHQPLSHCSRLLPGLTGWYPVSAALSVILLWPGSP